MHKIKQLLEQKAHRLFINKNVEVVEVGLIIEKMIRKFFDEDPNNIKIVSFKNGTLLLASSSIYVRNALNTQRNELIELLNKEIGREVIKEVRLKPLA